MSDATILLGKAKQTVEQASHLRELDQIRIEYLGKKGHLTLLLSQIGRLPSDQRKDFAQNVNLAKEDLNQVIADRKQTLQSLEFEQKIAAEKVDIHLPGEDFQVGHIHPISRVIERLEDIFTTVGFEVQEGLEIEDDFHNFGALNFSQNHPARAMHDTFYFNSDLLLRTHTSSAQIRAMNQSSPPFRIIAPGRVYRCDSDQTHTPMFHQVEGLLIDRQVSFVDLHAMLTRILKLFFNDDSLAVRFRPSYFPFTEPSAEVDIFATQLGGDDWLEVLGCGMVHPNVLKNVGIDSKKWCGYAFGIGVERLAMLYYGISDLRRFFVNDLRFIEQF